MAGCIMGGPMMIVIYRWPRQGRGRAPGDAVEVTLGLTRADVGGCSDEGTFAKTPATTYACTYIHACT